MQRVLETSVPIGSNSFVVGHTFVGSDRILRGLHSVRRSPCRVPFAQSGQTLARAVAHVVARDAAHNRSDGHHPYCGARGGQPVLR